MSDLRDLLETAIGALVLSFGVVAGTTVYATGSIGAVGTVAERFARAVVLTFLPSFSLSAWPNVVAAATGTTAAVALDEPFALRFAGFLATYVSVAVLLHYLVAP